MQFAWVTAVGRDILIPSEKPIIAECLAPGGPGREREREIRGRQRHSNWQRGACKAVWKPCWGSCGWHDNQPLTADGDRPRKQGHIVAFHHHLWPGVSHHVTGWRAGSDGRRVQGHTFFIYVYFITCLCQKWHCNWTTAFQRQRKKRHSSRASHPDTRGLC